jgi:hypothetical protein
LNTYKNFIASYLNLNHDNKWLGSIRNLCESWGRYKLKCEPNLRVHHWVSSHLVWIDQKKIFKADSN